MIMAMLAMMICRTISKTSNSCNLGSRCSSVRLVAPTAGRSVEDDDDDDYEDYSLYPDEDYAELEQAFEFTF